MVYRGLYSYRQQVRDITLFPNIVFNFCKNFESKVWRVQVVHLHNEARALSSPSRLSTNFGKDFFRYLWYYGKKQIECGLTWHYWWLGSTDLGLINWHVFEQTECRNCCLYIKPRPNDLNMPTQHAATLLSATCCVRLASLLRHVATCWALLAPIWPFSKLSQQHPTCRNTSQHGGQTHATCCTQQYCDVLCWHVAIVWPRLYYSENRATSRIWKVLPTMVFPPIWGKKWRRSEHAHASYPGLFFRPPGFIPYKGQEESRVQGLD